jgi:serpin B
MMTLKLVKHQSTWLSAVLVVCLGLTSCQSEGALAEDETPVAAQKERQDIPLTKAEESIVQGNNAFGFHLLQAISEEEQQGNIFLSPLSATLALGMLNNGVAGVTSEEIRKALGYCRCFDRRDERLFPKDARSLNLH